jgi:hypothetical protein
MSSALHAHAAQLCDGNAIDRYAADIQKTRLCGPRLRATHRPIARLDCIVLEGGGRG